MSRPETMARPPGITRSAFSEADAPGARGNRGGRVAGHSATEDLGDPALQDQGHLARAPHAGADRARTERRDRRHAVEEKIGRADRGGSVKSSCLTAGLQFTTLSQFPTNAVTNAVTGATFPTRAKQNGNIAPVTVFSLLLSPYCTRRKRCSGHRIPACRPSAEPNGS